MILTHPPTVKRSFFFNDKSSTKKKRFEWDLTLAVFYSPNHEMNNPLLNRAISYEIFCHNVLVEYTTSHSLEYQIFSFLSILLKKQNILMYETKKTLLETYLTYWFRNALPKLLISTRGQHFSLGTLKVHPGTVPGAIRSIIIPFKILVKSFIHCCVNYKLISIPHWVMNKNNMKFQHCKL